MKWLYPQNDGIVVNKERIEKWSYTKWPPHSKYILLKNLKYILLLTILIAIAIIFMFQVDMVDYTHYLCSTMLCLMPIGVGITTWNEWKYGKNWD